MAVHIFKNGEPQIDETLEKKEVLWRYMDAARFFDFIHSGTLYFSRGDQFQDKYEGAFTKALKREIENSYKKNEINFTYQEFKKRLRERVFLNCWHASKDDSMAMWHIYGLSKTAVAITTTIKCLDTALRSQNIPHHIYIRKVEYVKHWRNPDLKISPYSKVFSYKTKAYDFEKEVRVIVDRFEEEFDKKIRENGMPIPVDQSALLRSIVVGPDAPLWFLKLVKGVAEKYRIKAPVKRSKLWFKPV